VVVPRRRRALIIAAAFLLEPLAMWLRGYPLGGNLVVRCREGHLFRTLWIPGVSLKGASLRVVEIPALPGRTALVGRDAGQGIRAEPAPAADG
jgi:hypothetical protein